MTDESALISAAMRLLASRRRQTRRICAFGPCSRTFEGKGRGKFCGDKCRHAAWRGRRRAARLAETANDNGKS